MKDFKNYLIAVLAALLALSLYVNVKEVLTPKNPTPYHEGVTIAFQTCMNLYTNQPASFSNAQTGWASTNTSKAILECAKYANGMESGKYELNAYLQ